MDQKGMSCHVIVIGSGCSGAMAAQTLVEAGCKVLMIDGGLNDQVYRNRIPDKDFTTLRKTDTDQSDYFLGKNFEGIPWGRLTTGGHLTSARKYVVKDVEKWLPLKSSSFDAMQSLALGGLGSAWGLGAYAFSDNELKNSGLNPGEIKVAYNEISARIGISGDRNTVYSSEMIKNLQKPAYVEENMKLVYAKFQRSKSDLETKGYFLERTPLALLTEDKHNRKASSYTDMDYYANPGLSAYRPEITISYLKSFPNFTYLPGFVADNFSESDNSVKLRAISMENGSVSEFECEKLVISCGPLATSRIVLKHFKNPGTKLPILCNHYLYVPCLNWRALNKPSEQFKSGFSQYTLYYDHLKDHSQVSVASLFTYRSMMLFRLIKESPLNFRDGLSLFHFLQSSLVIAGVHFPETGSRDKFISLDGNVLNINYQHSSSEKDLLKVYQSKVLKGLKETGLIPLKVVDPGIGASIHYAGTLPFSDRETDFTLSPEGKLAGTKNVYVSDASGFQFLPAKGLTLTLMANSHQVAKKLINTD